MKKSPVLSPAVTTRDGDHLLPMATYLTEPSQRAVIRARSAQAEQRIERDRREAMALLRQLEPPARPRDRLEELDNYLDLDIDPEPVFNAEFITGLIAGVALSVVVAGAGALILAIQP